MLHLAPRWQTRHLTTRNNPCSLCCGWCGCAVVVVVVVLGLGGEVAIQAGAITSQPNLGTLASSLQIAIVPHLIELCQQSNGQRTCRCCKARRQNRQSRTPSTANKPLSR